MKLLQVQRTDNNRSEPAEIRSFENGVMTLMVKDYETAKMSLVNMTNIGGEDWKSADGKYTCKFAKDGFTSAGEVLVRVPKKA